MINSRMKKLAIVASGVGFLTSGAAVFAQNASSIPIRVVPPGQGVDPTTTIGTLLTNVLTIVFIVAALAVLFMLIWGAFQWITSGGDKEAVQKARGRIIAALVGLAVLALAFLIVTVVGQVLSINILKFNELPTLSQCERNQRFNPQSGRCETVPVQQ